MIKTQSMSQLQMQILSNTQSKIMIQRLSLHLYHYIKNHQSMTQYHLSIGELTGMEIFKRYITLVLWTVYCLFSDIYIKKMQK